jgi:spore maturation protein CgeB
VKIALLDTYYPRFLAEHYRKHHQLAEGDYEKQLADLLSCAFGTSDFYSRHLKSMGHNAQDLIVNCLPLQKTWAQENKVKYSEVALRMPQRLSRLPLLGSLLSMFPSLVDIAIEQIKAMRPDVLYCQDLWFLSPIKLAELRPYVKLIVGQTASPLPQDAYLKSYDLILTSFPHFVPRLKAIGVAAEYFRIGFDTRVLDLVKGVEQDIDASFVGGISRHHGKALPMLEYLADTTPIQFFGYISTRLDKNSPIVPRHHGEVWGSNMYRTLARSRITLNRHINVAENNANNMRLYEATGVGALLLTDRKTNLGELFEIGKEVVVYSNPEEAAEMIRYYIQHPAEADLIARAGQERTLREHTYKNRMNELASILAHYL